ncbi:MULTISPECIES: GatB/YqeY domain-containing protein [unclassified Oleiphilus]|nr:MULTISPECIES: GatB/YqeY domain-containing protein [unclassified Oleiphilus]
MSEAGASTLKASITSAMKEAMKARAKERLATIRLILAEFKRIEVDERIELDDARVLAVLDKMLKQRRDSISQYEAASRQDLADVEAGEIAVIETFLPAALTAEEIDALVAEAVASSGAESVRDMGKVMAVLKPQLQGRADVGKVSQIVKQRLAS